MAAFDRESTLQTSSSKNSSGNSQDRKYFSEKATNNGDKDEGEDILRKERRQEEDEDEDVSESSRYSFSSDYSSGVCVINVYRTFLSYLTNAVRLMQILLSIKSNYIRLL